MVLRAKKILLLSLASCLLLMLVPYHHQLAAASFLLLDTTTTTSTFNTNVCSSSCNSYRRRITTSATSSDNDDSSVSITPRPIIYEEPLFRPPGEWRSLILQVTIGCSWNRCTFCEMYQTKQYQVKPLEEIEAELLGVVQTRGALAVRDVFLADGDAMTLPTQHLQKILQLINHYFPKVRRVSSYCLPRNIYHKTLEDLILLKQAGLSLVYVGCESGCNTVLKGVEKGETFATSVQQLTKLQQAGIKRSIMILLGLGGLQYSTEHAIESARLASVTQPEFLSVLTTSFPKGLDRIQQGYQAVSIEEKDEDAKESLSLSFQPLTARESLQELHLFLQHLEITTNKTVFRSDHASNYLVLKGRLGRDKLRLKQQLTQVLDAPPEDDFKNLRPEWSRGL